VDHQIVGNVATACTLVLPLEEERLRENPVDARVEVGQQQVRVLESRDCCTDR